MHIKLDDISSKTLVTVAPGDPMNEALARMKTHRVRHLPVIEADQVVGILSDRDIARALHVEVHKLYPLTIVEKNLNPEFRVRDFMSVPVRSIESGTPIAQVARRMIDEKISAYLVVDGEKLRGIVTSEDLLRVLADAIEEGRHESIRGNEVKVGDLVSELERKVYESPLGPVLGALSSSGI